MNRPTPATRRNRRGFTLVELLVVILIILLVSAVTLPTIIPALTSRQVGEAARIVQAAIAGARDAAIRSNAPRGIRLIPDLRAGGSMTTTVDVRTAGVVSGNALTSSRIIPIEPAPDLTDTSDFGSATFFSFNIANGAGWGSGGSGAPPLYPFPVTVPPASRGVYPFPSPVTSQFQVLMVVQSVYVGNNYNAAIFNPPTNWFWNVRIGDKFRFTDSGRYYTVVGPMTVFNPELLVNDGVPGTSTLNEHYGPSGGGATLTPEYLFLVNGVDDSGINPSTLALLPPDGYPDNGMDGINFDPVNGYNFDTSVTPHRPLIDEVGEWVEIEKWLGAQDALARKTVPVPGTGPPPVQVPPTFKWTITRRPVPSPGAREIALPGGAVIDLTTWDTTRERSRLPVDPLNGTVDILLDQAGKVVPTTTYSNPSSAQMGDSFFHFWVTDRTDVYDPAGLTFPALPMPPADRSPFQYPGEKAADPAQTIFLKKDRQLVSLFTRTGQVVTNSIETFDFYNANAPYAEAQLGVREAK